jgi:hypothetical protein
MMKKLFLSLLLVVIGSMASSAQGASNEGSSDGAATKSATEMFQKLNPKKVGSRSLTNEKGERIDIREYEVVDSAGHPTRIWFYFKDGKLLQWGKGIYQSKSGKRH